MSKANILRSVRLFCLDCTCGSADEVKNCSVGDKCPLWPYRMGNDPDAKRELTEEQRAALAERARANFGGKS